MNSIMNRVYTDNGTNRASIDGRRAVAYYLLLALKGYTTEHFSLDDGGFSHGLDICDLDFS
jgi:hypothetical protein